jgi:hypothetical protein
MGASYEAGRLCCDRCDQPGGVRRRQCPHFVTSTSLWTGERTTLRYCPAVPLCDACYRAVRTLHTRCRDGAAYLQAVYDADQARLEAGDAKVTCREGDRAQGVPDGHYRATFTQLGGTKTTLILPDSDNQPDWLSDATGVPIHVPEPATADQLSLI